MSLLIFTALFFLFPHYNSFLFPNAHLLLYGIISIFLLWFLLLSSLLLLLLFLSILPGGGVVWVGYGFVGVHFHHDVGWVFVTLCEGREVRGFIIGFFYHFISVHGPLLVFLFLIYIFWGRGCDGYCGDAVRVSYTTKRVMQIEIVFSQNLITSH